MPRKASEVTETELRILDVLWECGPSFIRDIVETVYGKHTQSLHATVKSLLERLERKGYVEHDDRHHMHLFTAKIDRETLVGQQMQQLADSHYDGSMTPMLLSLVDRAKLSRKQRLAIKRIIDGIE